MDFDKPKVYGDTSITDGLVFANNTCLALGPEIFLGLKNLMFGHRAVFLATFGSLRN